MPKFSETEKEQIRQSLLNKGRELFIQYGLAKTSIDDIVHACGIAKGSFYRFFSSKEELFYVILKQEEEVRANVLMQLFREDLPPKQLIRAFFHKSLELVEENPFFRFLFQDGEYERVIRKLPQALHEEWQSQDVEHGVEAVNRLIKRGVLPNGDPQLIVGIMKAVMLLRLHKDKFGATLFPLVMEKIIDYVSEGLTKEHE